jgi:7,8-dihydro-6-hydroxymethylpterin dimethyltransferase
MDTILSTTESLCPLCLDRLPAGILGNEAGVYLEKTCALHGTHRTIIWRGSPASYQAWLQDAGKAGLSRPSGPHCASNRGCPFDCGLCPDHLGESCSAALMVTSRCNLECPECFTSCRNENSPDPTLGELEKMLCFYRDTSGGPFPLELCGGEPTVRPDLPDIVAMARTLGFSHIQVNTNGVMLGLDPHLAISLKEAGATVVYLGFNGIETEACSVDGGRPLVELKMQALEHCAKAGIAVVLVPVLMPGKNLDRIGRIIEIAKQWIPHVKGVHFQPMSYFGIYPAMPTDENRVTIPEILRFLTEQTNGELKEKDFIPPGCEHPLCSFQAFYILSPKNKLQAVTTRQMRTNNDKTAERARAVAAQQWRASKMPTLSIGGMLFQDAWNVDLERLRRCGIHIIGRDQKLVPLCAKYLTAQDGRRLYPGLL